MKYLDLQQIKTNGLLGKSIEQWLGVNEEDNYSVLKWIIIEKEKDTLFSVVYMETLDEGDENFIDIYEFSAVDPDEPFGLINSFPTLEQAIDFSIEKYGAAIDRFVNSGVIQEEYLSYHSAKK
ncbi:MAG: hypothetical protein ACO1N4_09545 [Pedobacter sp.]